MACPTEITVRNLNGKFVMNKTISDNPDSILALQGLSWLTRKAISFATVTLSIKEYQDDQSTYHIDILSNASGLSKTEEKRVLNWTERDHTDKIFGTVKGKSRLISLTAGPFEGGEQYSEDDVKFLEGKILKDGKTETKFTDEEGVQSYVKNQDASLGWSAEQVWNFEIINDKRYYTRRVVVKNADGSKTERGRLVYDYLGSVKEGETAEDEDLAYGEE